MSEILWKIYILSLFRYVFLNQNISHSMFFQAQETVLSAIGGCSVEQGLFFTPGTVRDPSSPCGTAPWQGVPPNHMHAPPKFEQLSQKLDNNNFSKTPVFWKIMGYLCFCSAKKRLCPRSAGWKKSNSMYINGNFSRYGFPAASFICRNREYCKKKLEYHG